MAKIDLRGKHAAVKRVLGGEKTPKVAKDLGVNPDELDAWRRTYSSAGYEALRERFAAKKTGEKPPPEPDIATIAEVLEYAGPRPETSNTTYGRYLSDALAVVFANGLRDAGFEGVLPDEHGRGLESHARSARGFKKLDVNYSTTQMGLGLGVSLKTVSFRDPGSKRYTKNYSRNDNELRAEAMDYHVRQPYAVLAGILFLPVDAATDGDHDEDGTSSFAAAVRYFWPRSGRTLPTDEPDRFERFFVAIYSPDGSACRFYDVDRPRPPRQAPPEDAETLSLIEVVEAIRDTYDRRNNPEFEFRS